MKNILKLDWIMMSAVILLLAIGLMALWSISFQDSVFNPGNFQKQITSILIGSVLLVLFAFYDYRVLSSFSTKLYFALVIVLMAVVMWGQTIRGTTGWIGLGA